MSWRRRWATADIAVRIAEGWRDHRTGKNTALLSHFGFISVFPLLLVFVTVLGFVLEGSPDLRDSIEDSALANIPVVGTQFADNPDAISGSWVLFTVGLITALWAGTKALAAAQVAMDDTWEEPLDARPNIAKNRLRALVMIGVIGVAQISGAAVSALAGNLDLDVVARAGLVLGTFVINTATLVIAYQVLTTRWLGWRRDILPGAVVAAVVYTVVQLLGTTVVQRSIANASDVYGTFATVIGLLSWLSLLATATMVGAELNAALHRRREDGGAPTDSDTPRGEAADDGAVT